VRFSTKIFNHILLAFVSVIFVSVASAQNHFYVASTGSDSNNGSQTQPWRTITHADSALTLGAGANSNCGKSYWPGSANVGTCVHVLPGTYSQGEFATSHSGTASQNIVFICEVQFACLIRGTATGGSTIWIVNGANSQVIGFDVSGSSTYGIGVCITGSGGCPNVVIGYNHVHNLTGTCGNSPGGSGIGGKDAVNPLIIGNEVNHIDVTSGGGRWCHGIYLGGPNGSPSGRIYNNYLHDNPNGWGIDLRQTSNSSWWFDISNNTIVNNGTPASNCSPGSCGGGMTLDTTGGSSVNVTANNNIIYNNKGSSRTFGSSAGGCNGCSFNNNNLYGNTDSGYANVPNQPAPLAVNPQMICGSSCTTGSDIHLMSSSPLIGAGTYSPCSAGGSPCVPTIDYAGLARPSDISIGALESGSGSGTGLPSAPTGLTATVQ
jgi:hypothetical protein